MVEPPHGAPKRGFPWIFVVFPAVALVFVGGFLAIWQFLSPSERKTPVAYTDFVSEVRAGRVDEIVIHDREIRYRTRGAEGRPGSIKETIGPVPDQRMLDTLKPDDPNVPAPKIRLEK